MKALTVQQPWAWAIFHGKTIENRSTLWKHRGPLAIHAGTRWSERGERSPLVRAAPVGDGPPPTVRGAIIGTVKVVDTHRCTDGCCGSDWAEVAYREHKGTLRGDVVHLVLKDPVELTTPVPVVGRLGLWTLPSDVEADLIDQLCSCPPCPGRGNDGHGLTHCAECCFGTGVEAEPGCLKHGVGA